MTGVEIAKLKELIVGVSAYYGHEIPHAVLSMYVDDLSDLPFARVAEAIQLSRRDPKNTRFPLPAVIRDKIAPVATDDNEARESAARIVSAVSRYGWTNPERARDYIGELGWRAVAFQGGWENVCQTLTHDNQGQMQAQWRELCVSSIRRGKAGTLDVAPALPAPSLPAEEKPRGLVQLKQIFVKETG